MKRKTKQAFYVFDEHTDVARECQKIGLEPYGYDFEYPYISEDSKYILEDTKYIVVSPYECYSGWAVTLMALPCLHYDELIALLETTKIYDEIVGCIGILLKNYAESFMDYLTKVQNKRSKKIKRIILHDIVGNSSYVAEMDQLIRICRQKR